MMSQAETPSTSGSSVVAVYPDHASAERAVRRLHAGGFAMSDLSIVERDFQVSEEPVGFVSTGDFAAAGAGTGAWVGGLFGLLVGAAFLILPGLGPVIVAGPLSAALLGGVEGPWRERRSVRWGSVGGLGSSQRTSSEVRDPGESGQIPGRGPRHGRRDREGQGTPRSGSSRAGRRLRRRVGLNPRREQEGQGQE